LNQLPPNEVFSISVCQIDEGNVPFYAKGMGLKFEHALPFEIARRLQLSYYPEENDQTEVCFINSPEVRSEFKVSFTLMDLSDYLNGILSSPRYQEQTKNPMAAEMVIVPYPPDIEEFWALVEAGRLLRSR
jgi:predicted AAA+ superfamily ATPase